jgi:hypothetical protein
VQWWWHVFLPGGFSVVLSAVLLFVREAPIWQILIFGILLYIIALVVGYIVQKHVLSRIRRPRAEEQARQDRSLQDFFDQIQRWQEDVRDPLEVSITRRARVRSQMLGILKRVDSDGKRSVLRFLHESQLIEKTILPSPSRTLTLVVLLWWTCSCSRLT